MINPKDHVTTYILITVICGNRQRWNPPFLSQKVVFNTIDMFKNVKGTNLTPSTKDRNPTSLNH